MKSLSRILSRFIFGVLILLAIGFFLPGSSHVERSADIHAPASVVYSQVDNFKNWNNWSPWFKLDPNAVYTYSEPASGMGAYFTWDSANRNLGKGKTTILKDESDRLIHTKTELNNVGEVIGDFTLTPADSSNVHIVWTYNMDYGLNPFMRWMGMAFGGSVAKDYEHGLASLKEVCEKK